MKCTTCDGEGRTDSNPDVSERAPWSFWTSLPPGQDIAVRMGMVKAMDCTECEGKGTYPEAPAITAPNLSPDDLAAIQAPLPDEARMDAYYYGLERTGVGFIDGILSAVAVAGKGSHHTQSWNEESDYGYYANRPGLPDAISAVDLIQKAAEAASESVATLLALVREQQARLDKAASLHYPIEGIMGMESCGVCADAEGNEEPWPCLTIAALTASRPETGS